MGGLLERGNNVAWMNRAVGSVRTFVDEVKTELKKSSWPTWGELMESTWIIIVAILLLGAFVGLSDLVLIHMVRLLVGAA